MISFKQLTYALAASNTLHFKKAADQCHVSQSTLSTALTELEKQLGLAIFERDNKKVLVTPIGHKVLEKAREIVLHIEALQDMASSVQGPLSFPLTLGAIPTIAPYFLPKLLPALEADYPHAQLNLVEDQSHILVDKVRRGEIDTAVLALPYNCEGLLTMECWQEDFYWIAPVDLFPIQQQEISSEDIDRKQLMLLKEGHCLKDHILDVCRIPAEAEHHGFAATSLYTLIQMVRGGMGTTLIPAMAIEPLITQNPELAAIHLKEPSPHRRIAFVIRPNYTRMPCIEALIKASKQALGG